ncbi:hypothetical protein [Streptomyces sp. NPDC006285]|uniref:hypothetical protein n=1 Tax=Streptomyces sp. NPDC006285 TaxID=3364742 RepID=UPI0036A3DD66
MGFAEGATFDARGSMALVGFCPQATVVERFPAQVSPALVVVIDDDIDGATLKLGRTAKIRLIVTNESQEVVFYVEQATPVSEIKNTGLPGRIALVAQFPITASKAGRYSYSATINITGSSAPEMTSSTTHLVVDQAWLDAHKSHADEA